MKILNKIPGKAKRIVAGSLAAVITAAAIGPVSFISASAFSLDYIEEIKISRRENGMPYRIMEIAPNSLQSTMGYYASGQEGFESYLHSYMDSGSTTSSGRTSYMNNTLYAGLINKKIMGSSSSEAFSYPLYKNGGYKEYMPWEVKAYEDDSGNIRYYSVADFESNGKPKDDAQPLTELALNAEEAMQVSGVFSHVPDDQPGTGEYNLNASYKVSNQVFSFEKWAEKFYTDGDKDSQGHDIYKVEKSNFGAITKRGLGSIGVGNTVLDIFNNDYMTFGEGSVTVVSDNWGSSSISGIHTAYPSDYGTNTITGGKEYTVSFDLKLNDEGKKAFFFIIGYNGSLQSSDTRTAGTTVSDFPAELTSSGHYVFRYSPPNTALAKTTNYELCVGVKSKSTSATFSNIRVTEKVSGENADYVQSVDYFELAPETANPHDTEKYYYYNLKFTKIEFSTQSNDIPDETAIYYQTKRTDGTWSAIDYYMTVGDPDSAYISIDENDNRTRYYTAVVDELAFPIVTETRDDAHPYRAVPKHISAYSAQLRYDNVLFDELSFGKISSGENSGYFRSEESTYSYVGTGGDYNFTPGSGSETQTIYTDKVWYSLGVVNNDWFKEKVLDCEKENGAFKDDTFAVTVTTLTPDTLMADKDYWISQLYTFDLIVISSGFNPLGNPASYSADIDAGEHSVKSAILDATNPESNKIPAVVDIAVKSCGKTNLAALATELTSGTTDYGNSASISSGGVSKNVYAFNTSHIPTVSGTAQKIVTSKLGDALAGITPTLVDSPYYDVYQEIDDENFIRAVKNIELLSTVISEAACMRSAINFPGRRVTNHKTKIRVLEIEPYSNKQKLTEAKVRGWFPTDGLTYYDKTTNTTKNAQITIECMSPAELCGMNNNSIIENYDIVYVGSSLDNMRTKAVEYPAGSGITKNVPNYNDDFMDGLYYSNIGDQFYLGNAGNIIEGDTLAGLNGVEYTGRGGSINYMMSGTIVMARDSGNDITEVIEKQLEEFADSGMPVIYSDDLITLGYSKSYYVELKMKTGFRDYDEHGVTNSDGTNSYRYMAYYEATLKSEDGEPLPPGVKASFKWYYHDPADGNNHNNDICIDELKDKNGNWEEPVDRTNNLTNAAGEPMGRIGSLNSAGKITEGLTIYCGTGNNDKRKWQKMPGQYYTKVTLYYEDGYTGVRYTAFNNRPVITSNTIKTSRDLSVNFSGSFDSNGNAILKTYAPVWNFDNGTYSYQYIDFRSLNVERENNSTNDAGIQYELKFKRQVVFWFDLDAEKDFSYNSSTKQWEGKYKFGKSDAKFTIILKCDNRCNDGADEKFWDVQIGKNGSSSCTIPMVSAIENDRTSEDPFDMTFDTSNVVDVNKVDNTSYMYKFMSYAYDGYTTVEGEPHAGHPNAKAEFQLSSGSSDGEANKALMLRYLNLSTPKLKDVTYTEYPAVLQNNQLEVSFSITNPTDTSPFSTRYNCYLYVDENHDSKFTERERKSFSITENGVVIGPSQLKTTIEGNASRTFNYTIRHSMGSNFMGILPWKIVIIKTTDSTSHDSFVGYSYVKTTEPKVIKSLQIMPSDWATNREDGVWEISKDKNGNPNSTEDNGNKYLGSVFVGDVNNPNNPEDAFGQLIKPEMIAQTGVKLAREYYKTADDLNRFNSKQRQHVVFYVNYDAANPDATETKSDYDSYTNSDFVLDVALSDILELNTIFEPDSRGNLSEPEFLNSYNMLILGFGDSYGRAPTVASAFHIGSWLQVGSVTLGFNYYSAKAIAEYAEDVNNHTLLFCHDTTNTNNNYINYIANKALSTVVGWGQNLTDNIASFFGYNNKNDFEMNIQESRVKKGYYNNILMREALNLDRYGITYSIKSRLTEDDWKNNHLGDGYACDGTLWDEEMVADVDVQGNNVAAYQTNLHGNKALTRSEILDHNFSIAYRPKSARMVENTATGDKYLDLVKNPSADKMGPSLIQEENVNVGGGITEKRWVDKNSVVTKNYKAEDKGLIRANYEQFTHGFTNHTIARYMVDELSPIYTGNTADQSVWASIWQGMKSLGTYLWDKITGSTNHNIVQMLPIGAPDYPYYGQDSENHVTLTNKISQVNKGQITTYPYNVNTAEFGGSAGAKETNIVSGEDAYKITINPTHEQVYQANINGDEVSVWYCLAGSSAYNNSSNKSRDYDIMPNDVANNYYIFSVRNVIYTGAGHSNKFTIEEAELFLNTLVAGYRAGNEQPEVEFRDHSGADTISYQLVNTYEEELEDGTTVTHVEDDVAAVIVYDPNMNSKLKLTFYKPNSQSGSDSLIGPKIEEITKLYTEYQIVNGEYKVAGESVNITDDIQSETVYYVQIPEDIKQELVTNGKATIYAIAVTGEGTAAVQSNATPLYLRTAGLYDLS